MQQIDNSRIDPIDDEEEIDIKEIFSTILRYKKSILLITVVTTLFALFYAYFSPNVYQTQTLIKITPQSYSGPSGDFMSMAMGKEGSNIDDEIAIFQTRYIAKKALKNLNIGTQYFFTKHLKTHELYKNSPFVVTSESMTPRAQGTLMQLIPVNEKKFRLLIEPAFKAKVINALRSFVAPLPKESQPLYYDKIHRFGKQIDTPWFTITIQKVFELDNDHYAFTVTPNKYMDGFIQGNLSASAYTKFGNIIALNFNDNVPLRAKEIIEAVSQAYIDENLNIKSEGAKKKLHFIDMQLKAINETLKGSADKLQTYKATNIVVDLSSKAQLTAEKLSELESQLYEINMRTDVMENILNYINTHKDIRGINMGSAQNASPAISAIIAEIQKATSLYATISVDYTEAHPDVIKVSKQLDSLKSSLREAILSSMRTLNNRKHSLDAIIQEHKSALQSLPEQEQKLEQLTRNFMVNEKIYSFLLEKRAETAIVESSTVSDTRVVDAAVIPSGAIKPKRTLIVILGLIVGLILGTALAFLRDFLDNTIKTVEDIEKHTSIPLYGAVPLLDNKKSIQHYEEAMNVIWTNLEFWQESGKSKLITFTSSISGEGKTLTVSQLADVIAKNDKSVIILDLDMRRATLHEKYKLANTRGMSTLLLQKNTLEEVIQDTKNENLKIITSGPKPPNPAGLIMSNKLEPIINDLLSKYDFVLLDSPPIGLVSDAMKIMRMSDITLVLLKANYSKKDFIKNIERFTKDPEINAGIILNGIEFGKNFGYGYGYGYGYGSKHAADYYDNK